MMLLMFSILVAVGYILYSVWVTKGVPESLSETFYTLDDDGWLFQLAMIVTSITLLPVWLEVSETDCQWMAFLSCGGLMFVGCAPCFKMQLDGAVHYTSAIVCCVCAVLWQVFSGLWDVAVFFAALGGMLTLQFGKYMWWLECSVIASLYCNILRVW